ncbi:DNA polymerase III chi subunit [Vibrio astriarenae]|nr:DNA polymerase III chi subunit [Vibrio sp. C7]
MEPSEFIGHNLVGEGPKYGTSIEIGHQGVKPCGIDNW